MRRGAYEGATIPGCQEGDVEVFAYAGQILHVDLSDGRIWKEALPQELIMRFIGGRGINAKLLWDLVREPGIDPLSPENVLIFGTGALTCTTAPSSGRTTITCKGPATNLYLKTNMGGHWGAELKFAGYDHLVIHGASEEPVYLSIEDGDVRLRDASHIWGRDVRDATEAIKEELGDEDVKVALIGPAGENLVNFASIMNSVYHAAGRGGAGAVMGSKGLKAIAVRGTGEITVKEPERFNEIALRLRRAFLSDYQGQKYHLYGTGGFDRGGEGAYNYTRAHPEGSMELSAPFLVRKGYVKRHIGCFGCTQSCHRYTEIEAGPYAGTYTLGPEYETYSALGVGCGISDPEVVIKANDLCNIMGLDTISTGVAIQWAMESYERGVLTKEDTGVMELNFSNADAVIGLIPMIAQRRGRLGELLADGVMKAAERVGRGSWKWGIYNSKGLEMSRVEVRYNKPYALAFAVNPRGPDHLHTECIAAFGRTGRMRELMEEITGQRWPGSMKCVPEIVRWHEDIYTIEETLGFCAFTGTSAQAILADDMAEIFGAATGIILDEKEMMLIGRRILTLEKCFNIREGADRRMDDLPWRMMHEPMSWGPMAGMVSSPEWLGEMLDRYYALHGWERETGWPLRKTLEMLDLGDLADELDRLGKLPEKRS
ncbi:MAG: aldehyde ferredoxin oxidoreductase family protein [Candidatus Bathyarchaeia archaeon]